MGLSLTTSSCSTTNRIVNRAGITAEREAADRVDRGLSSGADAVEDSVVGGGEQKSGCGADESIAASAGGGAGSGQVTSEVNSNYDFLRGDRPIFQEDYASDNLGDFPRHLELVEGSWDVVEVGGRRFLRGTGGRGSDFEVVLPEVLPERFTIEYEVIYPHDNQMTFMATSPVEGDWQRYEGTLIQVRNIESGARMPAAKQEFFASVAPPPPGILSDPIP